MSDTREINVAAERPRHLLRPAGDGALHRDALLLANVRDSVIVTDLDGVVTYWNEGATRLFGFAAAEMIGRPLPERLPEPSRGEVAEWIRRIAAGEADFEGEWLDYRKDGSRVWVHANTRRINDADGSPIGIMGVAHDISDRKRAEEAQARKGAHLQLLSDVAALLLASGEPVPAIDAVFERLREVVDVAGFFHYRPAGDPEGLRLVAHRGVDEAVAARIEYLAPDEAVCGHAAHVRRAVVVDAVQQSTEPRTELIRSLGITAYACFPLLTPAGIYGTLSFTKKGPDRFAADELSLLQTVCNQVATALQRKAAEAALRASDERFRTLVQNVRDYAIFMIDPGGVITEWTEGAERVKGYTAAEAIGQHVSIFYTPEDVAAGEVERELAEAAREGRAERETWRVRKGGERFWGNEIATAIRGRDGQLLGFTKIARDLSDRRRMEEALAQSEQRHRLIIDNVRDYAIFMIDPDGRVLTWSTGAQRVFGYADADIIGRDVAVMFTPEDMAAGAHVQEMTTALSEGRASDDRWHVRKGGERFWASGVMTPLRDASGGLRGFVKVCRDLTERKQLEDQRERLLQQEMVARLEAEKAMTIRDEFLAVVSHELRTPLTAILLWSKMLRAGSVDAEDRAQAVEAIERSAVAQQQLIEDLLDISRMMSGKLRLDVREAELAPVVRAAVDAVRPMADARGVTVDASLHGSAGAARLDPDRMQQVAWNLLNNAVKFTGPGGRVSVRLAGEDGRLLLQVADTGKGIAADFLPHVFERFRQADATTTRAHGGLGLGLAITRQLVELHGGSVRVESAGDGKGSTFTVELPRHEARPGSPAAPGVAAAPAARAAGAGAHLAPVLDGLRVLLVEDETDTRAVVQWILEQSAADVTAVESAARAVAEFREALRGRPFDVIVSDVGMPVQDGYELIREIRDIERQRGLTRPTPAASLTAYAREGDRARAQAAGFQTHVPKPVEPDALVAAVAGLAGKLKQ